MRDVGDSELIEASIGNPERFDEIFIRHRESVFRFVSSRVGRTDAADLTAETFARAFKARHRYDTSRPSARSWLFGIAHHVCVDHLRRTGLRRRRRNQIAAGWLYRPIAEADRISGDIDLQSYGPALVDALRALSERESQALLLHAVADLTYQEIAEILDIPIGTVRSTLHRARRRMRELLPTEARTLLDEARGGEQ